MFWKKTKLSCQELGAVTQIKIDGIKYINKPKDNHSALYDKLFFILLFKRYNEFSVLFQLSPFHSQLHTHIEKI